MFVFHGTEHLNKQSNKITTTYDEIDNSEPEINRIKSTIGYKSSDNIKY